MNAEDIKKTINKIIFTQATIKQWQLLVGKFLLKRRVTMITPRIIINRWVWTDTPAEFYQWIWGKVRARQRSLWQWFNMTDSLKCLLTQRHFHSQELVPVRVSEHTARKTDDTFSGYQHELGGGGQQTTPFGSGQLKLQDLHGTTADSPTTQVSSAGTWSLCTGTITASSWVFACFTVFFFSGLHQWTVSFRTTSITLRNISIFHFQEHGDIFQTHFCKTSMSN